MKWLRSHGWEVAFGTTVRTLWFWPLHITGVKTDDFQFEFSLASRDADA